MRLLLVSLLLLLSLGTQAVPVVLGTFKGEVYSYEDSIDYTDNLRTTWLITESKKYNYTNAKDYLEIARKFTIDCSGHTAALLGLVIFNTKGNVIREGTVSKENIRFLVILPHTPQEKLYRELCNMHPLV